MAVRVAAAPPPTAPTAGGSPRGIGATPTGGGNGGAAACLTVPQSGTQLNGGNGQTGTGCAYAGGAGGSGYFGGGGGGEGGGGGGGSAYPASATTIGGILVTPLPDVATNTGAGSVIVDYTASVHYSHLHLWSQRTGNTVTLYALLTGDGTPLQNEPVTFGTLFATLCSNKLTNSSGIASCTLTHSQLWLVRFWYGYITAYFAGDGVIPPAHAQAFADVGGFF